VGFQRAETAAACPDKHLFNMTIKTSQTANAHGAHSHTHTHQLSDGDTLPCKWRNMA